MTAEFSRMAIRYNLYLKYFFGLGLALALPPISQVWLAFLSLSMLLLLESLLPAKGWRANLASGFAFGFGYFCFAFHWIGYAFLVDAEAYLWMMPFAVGGLAAFMALYWGIAFAGVGWLVARGVERWLALPAVLSLVEWLRGYLFTGFPWAAPGLIADGMGGVLQLASLVGMPGLTFLILLWSVLPYAIFLKRDRSRTAMLVGISLLLTLPLGWAWGHFRVLSASTAPGNGPIVRLVQPNVAQSDKWRSENAKEIFEILSALSTQPASLEPGVVIWPESAVPFLLDESLDGLQRIGTALKDDQTLLAGSIRRELPSAGCVSCLERYFTSILTIDGTGAVIGRYDKWRLVPGGEYLPLAWLLEPLGFRKVANVPESFSAGGGPAVSEVAGAGPAAMLICYEAIFPHHLVPAGVRPRWIVNVTNDGWFGQSVGPWQHLAQVRMRAVEQGLPVARAANTGISAMIDPYGRMIAQLGLDKRAFVDARLPESLEPTLFAKWGMIPAILLILGLLAIAGYFTRRTDRVVNGRS